MGQCFYCWFFFSNHVSAEDESKKVLSGVKYDGVLHEVVTKEDLDITFNIESICIDEGLF